VSKIISTGEKNFCHFCIFWLFCYLFFIKIYFFLNNNCQQKPKKKIAAAMQMGNVRRRVRLNGDRGGRAQALGRGTKKYYNLWKKKFPTILSKKRLKNQTKNFIN
jgi:hypothetical protein